MTTHNFSGFSVTRDGLGAVTGVAASSMSWNTSTLFRFQYLMDAPVTTGPSSITLNLSSGFTLSAVTLNGNLRVNLNEVASVGRYTWNNGTDVVTTTLLMIQTAPNVLHYYHLAGAALPSITNVAGFNAFTAAVSGVTSVIPSRSGMGGPDIDIPFGFMGSYQGATETDLFIGITGVDDWSTVPLQTGEGSDTVQGTENTDWVEGGNMRDWLYGNGGNDRLYGQDGWDMMYGGHGDDTLEGGWGNDLLEGGDGNDRMLGGIGVDTLLGGAGNDFMNGNEGNDVLYGGIGADTVIGGLNNDLLYGGADNDNMRGDGGNDTLFGEDGDDLLNGGYNDDLLDGGAGNDTLDGGLGDDQLYGGIGADSLLGNSGTDTMLGGDGNDTMLGGAGDDLMEGEAGDDRMDGGLGHDMIDGGAGADTLIGGTGDDSIMGDVGDDVLYGGTGADDFFFVLNGGADTVMDFRVDQQDALYFSNGLDMDAADIFAAATQSGTNVVFDLGSAGSVTVRNISLAAIENSIFVYEEFAGMGG